MHLKMNKKKFKNWRYQVRENLLEFCELTNLHGFQYMISDKTTTLTRIFFGIAFCCSFSLCLYLVVLQIYDSNARSTITSITSTVYPVWKIRFPAVTVCNVNVVHRDNIKKFKKIMRPFQINDDVLNEFLENLNSLVTFNILDNSKEYDEIFLALSSVGYNIDSLMKLLAQPCSSMIKSCSWQTHNASCLEIFKQIKTTHGYCCSFNYYGTREFAQNYNDKKNIRFNYAKGAGSIFSLRVELNAEESQYVSPLKNLIGFTIQVQDGFNYPDLDIISNTLEQDSFLSISISPSVYKSDEEIRSIPIKNRDCMFEDEGNLRWNSIYTFNNCINECITKTMFDYCKCVPFYYPEKDIQFCNFRDAKCLHDNRFNFSALINPDVFDISPENIDEDDSKITECNCYARCSENKFEFYIDKSKTSGIVDTNTSILSVFYNDIGCTIAERTLYSTWDSLLASIGGLFGLCIGGSMISILEFAYFIGSSLIYHEKDKPVNGKITNNKLPLQLYVRDFNQPKIQKDFKNLKHNSITHPKVQIIFN